MQLLSPASKASPAEDVCARHLLDTVPLVMRVIRQHMRRHRSGLTVPQFRTLCFVSSTEGSSLSAAADFIGLSLPAMSRLVAGMVEHGLMERRPCEDDRRHFQAERGPARAWRQPAQEALHRGVAAREAVLLDQELPDGLAFDPALVQGEDALAQRLDARLLMGGPPRRRRLQQSGERGRVGQRAVEEHAMASGPDAVMGDGVATDAEVPGDPTIRLAQLQPPENLTDVGHRTPRSRHSSPPGVWCAP